VDDSDHYTFGPNNIYFHYTKANDDKDTAAKDGAQMIGLAYVYEFSKRTSVGRPSPRSRTMISVRTTCLPTAAATPMVSSVAQAAPR
jgi:hypothetical protein